MSSKDILATQDGFVSNINALTVGQAAGVKLGAGRTEADHPVDFKAGVWFHCQVGDSVQKGTKVATLYTSISEQALEEACQMIQEGIEYSDSKVSIPPVVSHRVTKGGAVEEFEMPEALTSL